MNVRIDVEPLSPQEIKVLIVEGMLRREVELGYLAFEVMEQRNTWRNGHD